MEMSKFTASVVIIALLLSIGGNIYQYFNPHIETREYVHEVTVPLSAHVLDSLKLGFKAEFEATLKPKIVKIEDSTRILALLREIIAYRDSLSGLAELHLAYKTDNLAPYGDSLAVDAEFIRQHITVEFHPAARVVQIPVADTVRVIQECRDGFWGTAEKVGIFVGGVLIGSRVQSWLK